ncbi:hypothetical protein [Streptomyces sp. NPDC087300]|uniref:hypothetical protein n=1 Tax=Streptomyces sp. NPDC087300 TaxID=3365780 RepID=UPI003810835E
MRYVGLVIALVTTGFTATVLVLAAMSREPEPVIGYLALAALTGSGAVGTWWRLLGRTTS